MTSMDLIKSTIKNILTVTFVIGMFLYLWYFRPKKNALTTVSEFREICEKHNCKQVYEFKPNVIDFSNPWLYGTTETIIYDDPESDSIISKFYFPFETLNKIKVFNICQLNSNYKYEFSKCLVFYEKFKNTLFFDEYKIEPKRFYTNDLNDREIDSMSNLFIKKYNNRSIKVNKNSGIFNFNYFENNKYQPIGHSTNYFKYDCLF